VISCQVMARHYTVFPLAIALLVTGCSTAPPKTEAPKRALTFPLERTAARLERGKYLVNNVVGCFMCHSQVDWNSAETPIMEGTMGGGSIFPLEGLPGRLVASNISPDPDTGAGKWSDEDFFRAMTQGLGKDGRKLFDMMPFRKLRALADEDLASMIVYVRSIPPVKYELPKTELDPVVLGAPPLPPRQDIPTVDTSDPVKLGAYLANASDCAGCHTPSTPDGVPIPGLDFAGGFVLVGPWGKVASANITPDPSGISYYDEATFLNVIRTGHLAKGGRKINNIMPWRFFRGMTDTDLKAVFAYLKSLAPVSHRVDNTEKPTRCKKCGVEHGLGHMNEANAKK